LANDLEEKFKKNVDIFYEIHDIEETKNHIKCLKKI